MTERLYVNAYAVTRHYGGPEEGGWWYNAGQPLASVPIRAKRVPGCSPICGQCRDAADGHERNGQKVEFCRELPEDFDHLSDDDAARVYEQAPVAHHLVPAESPDATIAKLAEEFSDEAEGDIYSVCGGVEVSVCVEDHTAALWPSRRPRYE